MDIASLSMALSQTNLQNNVGTSVLGKSLDMTQVMGDSLSKMIDSSAMENSVTPYLGGNFDTSI
jgi:hypothetical protein